MVSWDYVGMVLIIPQTSTLHELKSKLLVSLLSMMLPYIIPGISPFQEFRL